MLRSPEQSRSLVAQRMRVILGDTDTSGVLYYAAPMRWADTLISGWLADTGVQLDDLIFSNQGSRTVHGEVTHHSSLRALDEVDGTLWCHRRSRRSYTLRAEFRAVEQAEPASVVLITQVYVEGRGADARAAELPAMLVERLGDPIPVTTGAMS